MGTGAPGLAFIGVRLTTNGHLFKTPLTLQSYLTNQLPVHQQKQTNAHQWDERLPGNKPNEGLLKAPKSPKCQKITKFIIVLLSEKKENGD